MAPSLSLLLLYALGLAPAGQEGDLDGGADLASDTQGVAVEPDAEIEGRVRGPDDAPVAEAQVLLAGPTGIAIDSTVSDQRGRFRFPSAPRGLDVLQVECSGFVPLRQPVQIGGSVTDLELRLTPLAEPSYRTLVQSTRAPPPPQDGTSTTVISREDIQSLPGGTTLALNTVLATQPGFTPDNYGAVHIRGNFAGLQLRVDGIQLPPAIQDRLQQLLEPQIIDHTRVIVGGLPAEYGEDVAAVVDITTRQASGPWQGDSQLTYGTYDHLEGQANGAGALGPIKAVIAGALQTTDRGLDPPAASPIVHDQLQEGRIFLRLEDDLGSRDRLELLSVYAESHYQIPLDPTVLPLSDGPANALRGVDQYGNSPPPYIPLDSNPTEVERELFTALSWFHAFGDRSELQVTPFFRYQQSDLTCDVANELGPTADPGSTCSTVNHQVMQGGLQANQTFGIGPNDIKAGLLIDDQRSALSYLSFTRDDANPAGGADPSQTLSGEDDIDTLLTGIYLQDTVRVGKLTLLPGLRLDVLHASEPTQGVSSTLWGPSVRFGAAYAFTEAIVLHAYVGELWQPPSFDAPAAARILGLVPVDAPVPFDLKAETDQYAEVGLAARVISQLTLSLTAWGRLSQNTLDDNEVGDTALTADYNYVRGRAGGAELWAKLVIGKRFHAFANATAMVAQGEGISSSLYLFTPAQLAFSGYQPVDNAQALTANAGFDLADGRATTHLSALLSAGSGLRTGPTNQSTLPANTVVDVTLRHAFALPLKPELALDVSNLFNVVYAYRIATGSLSGTAYGSLRQITLRLIVPFGS